MVENSSFDSAYDARADISGPVPSRLSARATTQLLSWQQPLGVKLSRGPQQPVIGGQKVTHVDHVCKKGRNYVMSKIRKKIIYITKIICLCLFVRRDISGTP